MVPPSCSSLRPCSAMQPRMVSVGAFGFPNSDCAFQLEAVRRCYERGVGVIEDHVEAFRWYCKSAEQLYHTAEYSLAECFKHGRGVHRNEATAIEWYTKAAKHGLAQVRKLHGFWAHAVADGMLCRHKTILGYTTSTECWVARSTMPHPRHGMRRLPNRCSLIYVMRCLYS